MMAKGQERRRIIFPRAETKKRRSFERRRIARDYFLMEARATELGCRIRQSDNRLASSARLCLSQDTPSDTPRPGLPAQA